MLSYLKISNTGRIKDIKNESRTYRHRPDIDVCLNSSCSWAYRLKYAQLCSLFATLGVTCNKYSYV